MGGRHDDVAKLYRTLKARYPQAIIDVMAPAWCRPLLSRMPEVNEAIPMPLGHGALEIGERRKLGHSLREKRYDRAYVLPNSFKSALVPFFAGIPHRTGWRGEMRYGLLNDARVLDKEAWPLMVERYVALAYDKGVMRSAKDLPQPLLWPQLQVSDGEKSDTCNAFGISSERPMIGFCPGAELVRQNAGRTITMQSWRNSLSMKAIRLCCLARRKIMRRAMKCSPRSVPSNRPWCRNLAGETQLEQAVILIAACKAVVTNDSGLMHVAAALDRPWLRCMAQAARTSRRRCRTRRA